MIMGDGEKPRPGPAAWDETALPSEAKPQRERREFRRIPLALTVELRFASAEAALESSTVDISEGGVFIRMPKPRPEGTSIRLQVHVGRRVLEIEGVVVRTVWPGEGEPPGIGVLFTDIEPEDETFMHSLVRERLAQRSPPDPRREP